MIVEDFSDRLKKAMSDKQMKQVDLCNKTGIDKALISNYLSGKYKAKQDKLHKLAIALDVSSGFAFPQKICIFAENFFKYGKDTNKI